MRTAEEEEYESESDEIPDYIDEKGLCKYCKARYIHKPKTFKLNL